MTEADLDRWEQLRASRVGTGAFQWFGHRSVQDQRRRLAQDGMLTADGGMLAVWHGGAGVGQVEWWASAWGPPPMSSCWTIAIGLAEAHRGQGIGTAAQTALVAYLFDHTRVERIQASTDAKNVAEQRALERSGFELEGILRRGQWREGAWHDQALYSVLRPEPAGGR